MKEAVTQIAQHLPVHKNLLLQLEKFHQTALILGGKIVIGLIVFIVFWIIAIIIKKMILKIPKRHSHKKYVFKIISDFCYITILLIGIITALGTAGVNVSAIVASLGLSGFALGFALKDYLSNILAGFMILMYQPYKVGDNITVSGAEGTVIEINLRYTVLAGTDKRILLPNANMLNTTINVEDDNIAAEE